MIEIYDELNHIKNVLAHGFNNDTWKTDGKLLAMYYRDTGVKKSEALKKIKEKCEKYCESYNKTSSYKIVNTFVNNVYKKGKDGNYKDVIRNITSVSFHKDILKWFLNLEEGIVLSNKEIEEAKKKRPGIVIKANKPMNFDRIKYLFTIYIWTLIKEQYLDKPNIIYLNDNINKKRFKERADLKSSFNLSRERNFLYDLGYIDVNHGLGIIPKFKLEEKVFVENSQKTEKISEKSLDNPQDDDIITLSGDDLYQCGYWLLKQRNGSFICKNCGKEFAHYSKCKQEKSRKYCKECATEINSKFIKKRFCIDCGKEIIYNETNNETGVKRRGIRCKECRRRHETERKRKYRMSQVKPDS